MLIDVIQSLTSGHGVDWAQILAQMLSMVFVVLFILPLHEFAHGWVAKKLGDPTAQNAGRLTLNPLASVDLAGTAGLLLFGFGWAKPVPVDPRYFKNPKRGMAITALAGPVSNLLAALLGALILMGVAAFAPFSQVAYFFFMLLQYYVVVNVSLAVFNLLPVPPLDGSRILGLFLSDKALALYYRNQNALMMVLFVLVVSGKFSGPLSAVQGAVTQAVFAVARFPFQLAGVL